MREFAAWKVLAALAGGCIFSLWVKWMQWGSFGTLAVSAVCFFCCYGLVLLMTGERIVGEIWKQMMDRIRKRNGA